jgi:regulator of sirC expression with transglutaminase-like and TPR domain
MQLSLESPTPLEYFSSLVRGDAYFPLFEAALSLAQDENPDLDIGQVLDAMDAMVARLTGRVPADAASLQKMRMLNQFFFLEMGFCANANDFYAAENSFIDAVMRTRRGIPISLAVVWLELAHGIGLNAHGVSFPGHFLIKVNLPLGIVVIDPVTGRSLGQEHLDEMLQPFRRSAGLPGAQEMPLERFLRNASAPDIIARMLWNLKEIYKARDAWEPLLRVLERLIVLIPNSWADYRDRGLTHAQLGHTQQALADLECYLVHTDNEADVDAVADTIDALRGLERE